MKNKIAIASAFLAASSFSTAEIVVNDFLSFEGFVDSSYTHTDVDDDAVARFEGSDNNFAVDQVEISWLFDFDPVTAQIDTQYTGIGDGQDGDDAELDQAFVTYHLDIGGAITAGRYDSMLGFEAFESPGLYQFSTAYTFAGLGDEDDLGFLPATNQGLKYTYSDDTTFFGISLQDAAFNSEVDSTNRLGGSGGSSWAIEAAGSMIVAEGLTFFLGGVYESGDDNDSVSGVEFDDSYAVNAYATFETGAWIFAGEVNYGESDGASQFALGDFGGIDEEVFEALIMANMTYSDQASVTGRISYADHEADDGFGNDVEADFIKYTLAHNFAFTDNLLLVAEVSYADGEFLDEDVESIQGALELIFTF